MHPHDPTSLDNLHGIVEPTALPLWWPLAPGWWLLIAFVLVAVAIAAWRTIAAYRKNAYRREALAALDTIAPQQLPTLLKRVALSAYPRSEVASLTGSDWVAFLNRHVPGSFDDTAAAELSSLAYAATPKTDQADSLAGACRRWIINYPLVKGGTT